MPGVPASSSHSTMSFAALTCCNYSRQVPTHSSRYSCHVRCPPAVIEQIMTTATKQNRSIDADPAPVPTTHRVALKKLCGQIKQLYPKATEHINYGMPLFKAGWP